jgi:hypothetical protein
MRRERILKTIKNIIMTKNFHRHNTTLWLKSFDENWLAVAIESRRNGFRARLKAAWAALFCHKNIAHINLDREDILDMIDFLKCARWSVK